MTDFQLKVVAETKKAEEDVKRLDRVVNETTRARKIHIDFGEINRNFKDLNKDAHEAANTIKTFYSVGKQIPGIGARIQEIEGLAKGTVNLAKSAPAAASALQENARAGSVLTNSFEAAGMAAGTLIGNLSKAGFALFAVQQAVGALQSAFSGFFKETIGREIQLRETILKTQTTLASTNKVFRNGKEITDPYQKIVALTSAVAERIDSIRERSIALAGVTSGEVIEVFGIVASQIGQIGGGLKEAEDLAINFAAALGTFGIPLYQARQEIGSILRGDITTDSYLAKALGITNQDIVKAKTQTGGVVKFLEERLAAAVAGQRIAAQGFAGVVSNIKDLSELVSQRFGAGLLDPLLGGLTKVFDFLFRIREEVFAISDGLGRGIGELLSTNLTAIGGGSTLFAQMGAGSEAFAISLSEGLKRGFNKLQADATRFVAPVRNLFEEITKSIAVLSTSLGKLAQGFIAIKIENLKAAIQIFSNLAEIATSFASALGAVLRAYGQLLKEPFIQYLSQVATTFQLLEKIGVLSIVKLSAVAFTLISSWKGIVVFFQGVVTRIAALIAGMLTAVGAGFTQLGTLVASFAATLTAAYPAAEAFKQQLLGLATALTRTGVSAKGTADAITGVGTATQAAASRSAAAILNFFKFNAILLAIQISIAVVVDAIGKFQQAQEETARTARAAEALRLLKTRYRDVTEASSSAEKAARDYNKALAEGEYRKQLDKLEEIKQKINQLRYEQQAGTQSWGEFWASLLDPRDNTQVIERAIQRLLKEKKEVERALKEYDQFTDENSARDAIRLQADNRVNLEKELKELRRQIESDLFQQRQALAQKEVDIFRAAGELRIKQIEQANKKMIEGEEGVSRTALDALNSYIVTRERGVLEIEATKQTLAIEVANLEKQAQDYRFDLEKKIFELRKRSSENEIAAARARDALIRSTQGGNVPTDVASRQNRVVQFFTDKGLPLISAQALAGGFTQESGMRSEAINPRSKAEGIAQWLGDRKIAMIAAGARNSFEKQLEFAWKELQTTEQASLEKLLRARTTNQALLAAASYERFNGYQRIGSGTEWGDRIAYTNDIKSRSLRPSAALVNPTLQGHNDIGDVAQSADDFAAAIRGAIGAAGRLQALNTAITNATTADAFNSIADSVFHPVELENLQDELNSLILTYQLLATATSSAFNPDLVKLQSDNSTKQLASSRELAQILEGITKSTKLSDQEKTRLIIDLEKRHSQYVTSLNKELRVQESILAISRSVDLAKQWKSESASIYRDLEAVTARSRLEAEGVSPERVAAELTKLKIRQDLEEIMRSTNEALNQELKLLADKKKLLASIADGQEKERLQKDLEEAQKRIRMLEKLLKELPKDAQKRADAEDARANSTPDAITTLLTRWRQELNDTRALVASLAQTIQSELASAMNNAITGVLNGTTTIGEAFGQMFANIGKAFLDMATQMITKWMIMKLLGIIASGAGASIDPGSMAKGGGGGKKALVPRSVFESFAGGGYTGEGARLGGLDGQGGFMAMLHPRETVIDHTTFAGASLGGAVNSVVNVTISDSGTKVDSNQASQFGRMIEASVMSVINREKRPGGALNRR